MLRVRRTPRARQLLTERTGLPLEANVELVKLSDLAWIPGIRARLCHDVGVVTVEKMASRRSGELKAIRLVLFAETCFGGIAPLPAEAACSVARAREWPQVIEY